MLVLTVLSAVAGALGVVAGLMLLTGSMDSADFNRGAFVNTVKDDWWWYALFLVLAILGLVVQTLQAAVMNRSIRAAWLSSNP
jgi:hypothetical protein